MFSTKTKTVAQIVLIVVLTASSFILADQATATTDVVAEQTYSFNGFAPAASDNDNTDRDLQMELRDMNVVAR